MKQTNPLQPIFLADQQGQTLVIIPRAETIGFNELQLKNELKSLHALIGGTEVRHLVIDLGEASFFGSLILGAVTVLGQRVRDRGGKAVLCNAHDEMYEVLRMIRFDTILPYFRTLSAALDFVAVH